MIKENIFPRSTIYPLAIPEKWIGKKISVTYGIEENVSSKVKKFVSFGEIKINTTNFKFNREEANER